MLSDRETCPGSIGLSDFLHPTNMSYVGCASSVTITAVVAFMLVCVLALYAVLWLAAAARTHQMTTVGGRGALESENVVVDALNLTHWLQKDPSARIGTRDILAAIRKTAPVLRQRFPGRVVYVTKNRETPVEKKKAAAIREQYQEIAKRYNIYVSLVERTPSRDLSPSVPHHHAALGRDDFYMIYLARKYGCSVLTRDRFRDLASMKMGHLDRFHVYTYLPFRGWPERDYVNPSAPELRRLKRPATIDYTDVFDAT